MTGQQATERPARADDARDTLIRAALRCLLAQMAEESADAAADAEYAEERLAFAAGTWPRLWMPFRRAGGQWGGRRERF